MPDPIADVPKPADRLQLTPVKTAEIRRPLPCQLQTFRVDRNSPLPPNIQKALKDFCAEQYMLAQQSNNEYGLNDQTKRLLSASVNHSQGWKQFRDELGMNEAGDYLLHTPGLEDVISDEGVISLARDPQTGKIIGFSTALLNNHQVKTNNHSTYVGIASSDELRGRNLGIRLVALRNRALLAMGITDYETHVWPDSLKMYEKSGITMEDLADLPPDEPEGETVATSQKKSKITHHKITIDPEGLAKLCTDLGIDPIADPFASQDITI